MNLPIVAVVFIVFIIAMVLYHVSLAFLSAAGKLTETNNTTRTVASAEPFENFLYEWDVTLWDKAIDTLTAEDTISVVSSELIEVPVAVIPYEIL
jgi:hypothetical protein